MILYRSRAYISKVIRTLEQPLAWDTVPIRMALPIVLVKPSGPTARKEPVARTTGMVERHIMVEMLILVVEMQAALSTIVVNSAIEPVILEGIVGGEPTRTRATPGHAARMLNERWRP